MVSREVHFTKVGYQHGFAGLAVNL